MVWRVWGDGPPVVLLHGGSGSWTHWIANIPVLEKHFRLYVADIPGLGDSDMPPHPYDPNRLIESTEHLAGIVGAGLAELLPATEPYRLVGFSFGAVMGGHVAVRDAARISSFTMIGAAALGVAWPGLRGSLRIALESMTEAEVLDVQRHNLNVIMMTALPDQIDDGTAWLQLENTRRARLRTHTVAPSDTLVRALRRISMPLNVIWGTSDVYRCHNDRFPFPKDCTALVLGQPLVNLKPDAPANEKKEPLEIHHVPSSLTANHRLALSR